MLKLTNHIFYKIMFLSLIVIGIVGVCINTSYAASKNNVSPPTKRATIKATTPSVIHFTQAFCQDCHKVKPYIEELQKQYKDKISFLIIDIKNEDAQSKELIKKYRIFGVPTTIFLNKSGEKEKVLAGMYPENSYKKATEALLKK